MSLNISIKTIPHKEQRYDTSGDYYREGHKMHFRISEMQSKAYEFLVALHELVEQFLCELENISIESIDQFDIEYEKARDAKRDAKCGCRPTATSEPGDDKHAPYYYQHQLASSIERLVGAFIPGFNWQRYDETVNSL